MSYLKTLKPLGAKPESYPGFSERLVASHYENNYAGAVRRLDAISARLAALDPATTPNFDWNALKREELVAYNSMLLHEIHFEALGPAVPPPSDLSAAIERDFGSYDAWRARFAACGRALSGGSGWVVLVREMRSGRLAIQWSADHAMAFAGAVPLLALDMYEHAYHMDYGANAAAYVEAWLGAIDWTCAAARWRGTAAPADPHAATVAELEGFDGIFVDARRGPTFAAADSVLPGAVRLDPATPDGRASGLPTDREIVVYCVYGFSFSRDTAAALRAQGYRARHLDSGIVGWRASGGKLDAKRDGGV
ncbi:MAG: superoxide dismutase [Alphaproteobacteria bacterium]|nr:superoxide dismutase [Alphaproteobacteria bacterium]